jgi:glycosyltransferase involved in cell wall biosynthesis
LVEQRIENPRVAGSIPALGTTLHPDDKVAVTGPVAFSVVIPTRDRPHMLRAAVASALRDVDASGEVIVIDDTSTTPARTVLCDLADALSAQRLRILNLPSPAQGAGAARNLGLQAARGRVVFFLDDDDRAAPGYFRHVLDRADAACGFGFSAILMAGRSALDPPSPVRARFAEGAIPAVAPLRKKLCGFGMGFWIRADVARQIGAIDCDLSINEDTDYLCRLIRSGVRGWYSARPGVILGRHDGATGDLRNLTARTTAAERARCMRIVCERFPEFRRHLGPSYLRHCARSGSFAEAWRFIRAQPLRSDRARLTIFLVVKACARGLTGTLQRG